MILVRPSFGRLARGGAPLLGAACFVAGLGAGVLLAPVTVSGGIAPVSQSALRAPAAPTRTLRDGHPAEVLRVIDGDTFVARVDVWPGMQITTRVRLRGIDAAEMRARCDDERVKALAARAALTRILGEGAVGISRIGQDKYGGRVDADVSTADTPDVSAAMLNGGFARPYDGGRRQGWCG
jgi:endonuclease YncB( thermonuclease family)